MNHTNQNIADLLSDKEFINWVHKPTTQSDEYWSKWLEGHPKRKDDVNLARKILQAIAYHEIQDDEGRSDEILKNIIDGHYSKTHKSKHRLRSILLVNNLTWIARAAAIVAFLITFSIISNMFTHSEPGNAVVEMVVKTNTRRQKTTIYLPDSSKVILNAESTLEYSKEFSDIREIHLTGEAFFEVRPNATVPFIVRSGEIITTALGTSFNIKAYPTDKSVSVSLATGKVMVHNGTLKDQAAMTLLPGEKSICNVYTGEMQKVNFYFIHDLSWKDGVLVFHQANMHEFVQTIERWYDVQVIVEGIPDTRWRISGSFNNETLKNVLESLSFARSIEYSLQGDVVKLKFKV
ncbi:MAG: FecR family protein [Cyclobacteriaceae bacterium]